MALFCLGLENQLSLCLNRGMFPNSVPEKEGRLIIIIIVFNDVTKHTAKTRKSGTEQPGSVTEIPFLTFVLFF